MDNHLKDYFNDEFIKLESIDENSITYRILRDDEIEELVEKISLLPERDKFLLFFRFSLGASPNDIKSTLEIDHPRGNYLYIQKLLSNLMGLENLWISNSSIEKATNILFERENLELENIEINNNLKLSKQYKDKIRSMGIGKSINKVTILKRVAAFFLVLALSFSVLMATNVQARQLVFGWVIETFPEYSRFQFYPEDDDVVEVDLEDIEINYIPEGYELVEDFKGHTMRVLEYQFDDAKVRVGFYYAAKGASSYDTEDAEIDIIDFRNTEAFLWQRDDFTFLVWEENGLKIDILGNISIEEALKIGESIEIKK